MAALIFSPWHCRQVDGSIGIACSAEAGRQTAISASIISSGIMAEARSIDFSLPVDKHFITTTMAYQKFVELKIVYMMLSQIL